MRALSTVTRNVDARRDSHSNGRPIRLAAAAPILARLVMAAIGAGALAPVAMHAQVATPDLPSRVVSDLAATAASPITIAQPAGPIPTPEHTGLKALALDFFDDIKHLPASENLYWAAAGGAGALAVHPADKQVTPYFVNASWAHDVFAFGAFLGNTAPLLAISGTVYVGGRWRHDDKVAHLGMDLLQALALNNMIVQTLKYTTRRERPDGSGRTSFPSGHASDTFAVATALERHLGWRGAVPAYAFSSYVAMSRLHDNRHYLSDVVFGATVGIIAGRTVTRHGREFPVTVTAIPGGALIVYTRRPTASPAS
jgi:membrane-associated phospholipid phosphatase